MYSKSFQRATGYNPSVPAGFLGRNPPAPQIRSVSAEIRGNSDWPNSSELKINGQPIRMNQDCIVMCCTTHFDDHCACCR